MKSKHCLFTAIIAIFLITATGCSDLSDKFSGITGSPAYITGKITQVVLPQTSTQAVRILVEENMDVNEPLEDDGKKAWFTVTPDTDIYRMGNNGVTKKDDLSIFKKGQIVRVWDTGIIMTSYPVQTGARKIILLK